MALSFRPILGGSWLAISGVIHGCAAAGHPAPPLPPPKSYPPFAWALSLRVEWLSGLVGLLGGSWVVISRFISPLIWVVSTALLITPLITSHESPSNPCLTPKP